MTKFIRITDENRIKKVLSLDDMWKDIKEDYQGEPIINDSMWYLPFFTDEEELVGIGIAQWIGNNMICWHTGIRKKFRGPDSYKYAESVIAAFPDQAHITMVPAYKKHVIAFAKRLGFKVVSSIKDAVIYEEKAYNKLILEKQ